ncbi:MAG: ABC transporter permease subunit [Anaerolineales bacterium]|nr:ABC transporter permease subunit [Anaerolineales bacterium]
MTATFARAFVRERLVAPFRMALALAVIVAQWGWVLIAPEHGLARLQHGGFGALFVLVVGAGVIGQDARTGALLLIFTRPVRRASYVLGRWLGTGVLAAALYSVGVLTSAVVLMTVGSQPSAGALALALGNGALIAIAVAAVLVLVSTVVSEQGDWVLWIVAWAGCSLLRGLGASHRWPVGSRMGEEGVRFFCPMLDLGETLGVGSLSLYSVLSFFSTITLCLVGAICLINRRELSYAQR